MIRDYLEELMRLDRIEALWAFHVAAMAQYGFDRLLYGFTRFRATPHQITEDDFLILSNHDPEYLGPFVERGMYFHAPMVRWSFENVGACSWGWMSENLGAMTPEELRVLEFNRTHGVTAGYSISFKDVSPRSKGAIGLVARPGLIQAEVDDIWDQHGRDILLMNQISHLRITTLPFIGRRTLTPRQREVLEWVGDGKTTQDIASILGVSLATVEKHLRLAREMLEAETTAQAVLKASFQNQIFVVET
ncbi:MAG: LuxR family transcriptional regulator [Paracoccaceae bacterium]|nr:LuxR family transcriptional regulator [Paracoccaceae bacterium]